MNWFWFIVHGVHRNGSSLHRLWANWVILSKTNFWSGKCPLSRHRKTEINPPKMEEIQVLPPVPVGCWIHFLCTYWSYKFTASAHPLGDEFAIYFKLFLLTVVPILPPSNVPSFLNSSSFPLCIMYIPYLRDTCQLDSYLCTFRAL